MSDFLLAHGMLPLRVCDACEFKRLGQLAPDTKDGWCYMFKDEPKSAYCGQFKVDKGSRFAALDSQPKEKP